MNEEKRAQYAEGDVLLELEEAKKTDVEFGDMGPYSITYAYGGFLSIICC